jgi:hypothetical protein
VDEIIEIALGEDVDMDPAGITLRDIFFNYHDKKGNSLIDAIEKTSTGGTYRFLFQQNKTEEVDKMLEHIDETLTSIGDWEECHTHLRYLPSIPISVVGRIPRTTHPAFWANHLSQFSSAIPSKISTEFLQHQKTKHAAWTKVSYSDAAKWAQCQDTTPTAVSTARHSDRSYASKSNNDSNSSAPTSGDSNKHTQPEGAISGLSKLKRKLAEIVKERELYKIEQTKMEDKISTVTNSLSKPGDQMVETRQDTTALSGSLRTELAEMKQILLGMSKKTPPPRRKTHRRAKESELASSSSKDKIMAAASTSPTEPDSRWDSMCESGAEQSGRTPPATVTLATLEDFDTNGVDTSIRKSDRDKRKLRDPNTPSKPSEASPTGVYWCVIQDLREGHKRLLPVHKRCWIYGHKYRIAAVATTVVATSRQLITTIQFKTLSDNNEQITARILNAMEIYQHQLMKQQYGELLGVM